MPTFFLPTMYEICYILQRSLVNANTSAFGFLCQFLCLELLQNNKKFSFCWFRGKLFQNCCIVIKTSTCSGCLELFLVEFEWIYRYLQSGSRSHLWIYILGYISVTKWQVEKLMWQCQMLSQCLLLSAWTNSFPGIFWA